MEYFQSTEKFDRTSTATQQAQKRMDWDKYNAIPSQDISSFATNPLTTRKTMQYPYMWNGVGYDAQSQEIPAYSQIQQWNNLGALNQAQASYNDERLQYFYMNQSMLYGGAKNGVGLNVMSPNISIGRDPNPTNTATFFNTNEQLTPYSPVEKTLYSTPKSDSSKSHIPYSNISATSYANYLKNGYSAQSMMMQTDNSVHTVTSIPHTVVPTSLTSKSVSHTESSTPTHRTSSKLSNVSSYHNSLPTSIYAQHNTKVSHSSIFAPPVSQNSYVISSNPTVSSFTSNERITSPLTPTSPSTPIVTPSTPSISTPKIKTRLVPEHLTAILPVETIEIKKTQEIPHVPLEPIQEKETLIDTEEEEETEEEQKSSFEVIPLSNYKLKNKSQPNTDQWKEGENDYCRMGNEIWIRCQNPFCKKWRYIPQEEVSKQRSPFFCVSNYWDIDASSCAVSPYYTPHFRSYQKPISLFENHKIVSHFDIIPLVRRH